MSELDDINEQIAHLERPHRDVGLDADDLASDPFEQFARWMDDALEAGIELPNAMVLATADASGKPSARMVLLKGVEDGAFVFFTNYESRKGSDLAANPHAALVFHWGPQERQVCIRGSAARLSSEESDAYFRSRPKGSRIGAWASPQSRVIEGRDELDSKVAEMTELYPGEDIPLPPHWGGFRLTPDALEFWQARSDRLHDRLCYTADVSGGWRIERLAP